MKYLKKLAIEDGTESKLYKGHCIDRIYQLLGDSRITRWLTMICEKDPDDEEVLGRFIDFLKKELRVQPHKRLTQGKFEDKAPLKLKAADKNKQYQTRYTGQSNQAPKC